MKNQGIKTHVITLSKVFPSTHRLAGQPTGFRENFRQVKLHTIRANYDLWEKRLREVAQGKAQLAVRQWSGRPYHSKQENVAVLTAANGVGVQKLRIDKLVMFEDGHMEMCGKIDDDPERRVSDIQLSKNDGLSVEDFREWFEKYDLSKPLAIIHFTNFRY